MTNERELDILTNRMARSGATVTTTTLRFPNGREITESIKIEGAKGIGPCPMGPIAAAERMREWLATHA